MTEQSAAAPSATAFVHDSTLVVALELSGKSWEIGAVLPGVARRPRRQLTPRDMTGLLKQIERWKAEALRAGRTVQRTVLCYEAGRDGFWIARYLLAHGIEVQIMHPASIPVERRGRRVKLALGLVPRDRSDRPRHAAAHVAGLAARGAAGVLDGAHPERGRGGHAEPAPAKAGGRSGNANGW